jgi:hypothetical protein
MPEEQSDVLNIIVAQLVQAFDDNYFATIFVCDRKTVILDFSLWIIVGFIEYSMFGDNGVGAVERCQKRSLPTSL